MAGGQLLTASQGSFGRAVTVALAGAAITLSSGSITPNNSGTVPLTGQSVSVQQQAIAPSWGQALTGSASTSNAGTVSPDTKPSQIPGQASTVSAGTVTASGNSVTVNLSGVEFTSAQGDVGSGSQLLAGLVSTSAQGAFVRTISLPLLGIQVAVLDGNVSPNQDAVDSRIDSAAGNASALMSIALSGVAMTSAQGTIGTTGDVSLPLSGSASSVLSGNVGYSRGFPLTGQSITSAQQSMGAPGGASLTGSQVTVSAGQVFTTNDRSFALTGQASSFVSGVMFASPLAFATGQVIVLSSQGIGPRAAALFGSQIDSGSGFVAPPPPPTLTGPGGWGLPKKKKKRPVVEPVEVVEEVVEVAPIQPKPRPKSLDKLLEPAKESPVVTEAKVEKPKDDKAKKRKKKAAEVLLLL